MRPAPAAASIRYDLHTIYQPSVWNGMKIYVSPGHFLGSQNVFPCGYYANTGLTSEYLQAWHIGYSLKDQLVAAGYQVMMPKRTSEVGYTDRIDTAYDWWSDHTNNRMLYVAIHSNAGTASCSSIGGTQMLGQDSYDNSLDFYVGANSPYETFDQVSARSPGYGTPERWVGDRCTNLGYPNNPNGVYEICSNKARVMRTLYVESEFHSTTAGANWIYDNDGQYPRPGFIALYIKQGIDCYYSPASACHY